MDTNDIRCFELVYEKRSFNQAAKEMFISPQGLGRIIRNLEAECGTRFFERTGNGLIPTESAELFYDHARQISDLMNHMLFEMHQLANKDQVLRIGCANGIFHVLPLQSLKDFEERNPQLKIEWSEFENHSIPDLLKDHKLDYGCVVGQVSDPAFKQVLLSKTRIAVLVYEGHPLYEEESITLEMLKEEPLLTMGNNFHIFENLMNACHERGFEPNIAAKTMDGGLLYHLCDQKMGLAITPDFRMKRIWQDSLRAIPLENFPTWDVYGIYLKDNASFLNIRHFNAYLQEIKS